uniref:Pentapeptide repeat-containing protein n=1 Tax=Candidatus Kentrum sp. FM TaxID=2126340 RepID=A0A450T526_9GAMM|nr:MAG: Pentapeptide repeat-containing protein [Candidatus Kentron sp. FM]VFJ61682.1 MAG: Pentapeptide repeat-containing protein [Candidatus Kentron sp. FM]VFK12336.1 MAG: Pentapeptide repeat-containing protein [Candidatus Kentron sp. FM]
MNPFPRKAPWALYLFAVVLPQSLYPILRVLDWVLRVFYWVPWVLYTLSGLKHIVEMLWFRRPNAPDYRKPPTFFLWVIGLYAGLYGIAATHYEAALDRIENRMGALASQLATGDEEAFKRLVSRIPEIQAMKTPLKPDLLYPFRGKPLATYVTCQEENRKPRQYHPWEPEPEPELEPPQYFVLCGFLRQAENPEIIEWTRKTIEDWRNKLAGVNFNGINLSEARLWKANLSGAGLQGANLAGARLWRANLSGARLEGANLSGANLRGADLSEARLWEAVLSGAELAKVDLSGAQLQGVDLSGATLTDRFGKIQNWRAIASIQDANILGIKKAPEGFREWALEKGAVELEPAAWQAFLKKKREERW